MAHKSQSDYPRSRSPHREDRGRDREDRGRDRENRGRDREDRGRDREDRGDRGRAREDRGRDRENRGRDRENRGRNREDRGRDREHRALDQARQRHDEDTETRKRGHDERNKLEIKHQSGSGEDDVQSQEKTVEPDEDINFGLSGKLASETNTFKGVYIKYSEPAEARVPKIKWRLYEFKGDESKNTLHIHRQSAYLIGRDRKVVDFPIDHPSCSKQHAVLQYRLVDYVKDDGRKGKKVKPYLIDLESTNGTYINDEKLDHSRYVEIKEKDIIKFGFSTREYVLLNENSNYDEM